MQPAIVPTREARNVWRTSTSPSTSSTLLGREHADQRPLDVLGQLVDDAVGADVDALAVGQRLRLGVRAHVEADDDRVRRGREHDVRGDDAADARVDHLHRDLVVVDLSDLVDGGLDRALHVGLDDQGELLDGALLHLREQVLEADRLAALGEHLGALALRALLGGLAGDAVVLDDAAQLAGRRRLVEAEDLDRDARPGVLDALAVVVVQRLHLAPGVAGDDGVADAQRAALHQHRRDRAAADVEARLDDDAARVGVRVGLQLEHVGLEQDRVRAACRGSSWPSPRRPRRSCRRPTPPAAGPG